MAIARRAVRGVRAAEHRAGFRRGGVADPGHAAGSRSSAASWRCWPPGETWNVSSLVGLIGLFGIAVQNSLVLVTQSRGLERDGRSIGEAVREASIGRVRPKLMTAATAMLGLLPLLVLRCTAPRSSGRWPR